MKKPKAHVNNQKHCGNCDRWLDLTSFGIRRRNWDGLRSYCKECTNAEQRGRFRNNYIAASEWGCDYDGQNLYKDKTRNARLLYFYGISSVEYDTLYHKQEGKCAICDEKPALLCVDHSHETGEVRGLLCNSCNRALGGFKDDAEILEKAAIYLNSCVGVRGQLSIATMEDRRIKRKGYYQDKAKRGKSSKDG